jgi:hypothetical protein
LLLPWLLLLLQMMILILLLLHHDHALHAQPPHLPPGLLLVGAYGWEHVENMAVVVVVNAVNGMQEMVKEGAIAGGGAGGWSMTPDSVQGWVLLGRGCHLLLLGPGVKGEGE